MTENQKERVYLPGSEGFGDLQQRGVLGVKNAYKIVDDDGKRVLFIGKTIDDVVLVNENKTGSGKDFKKEIPVDIVDNMRTMLEKSELQEAMKRYRKCCNRKEKDDLFEEVKSQKKPSQKQPSQKKPSQKRVTRRKQRSTN